MKEKEEMITLVGWRRNEGESVAHYYRNDDSDPGADVISLCERFYAFRKDLVFPGPGMFFCSHCEEEAIKLKEKVANESPIS